MIRKTIYHAIRILKYLDKGPVQGKIMREDLGLGRTYQQQIINKLGDAGLVITRPGIHGGIESTTALNKITVQRICNAFDEECEFYKLGKIKLSQL